jgi:hypothetical protein
MRSLRATLLLIAAVAVPRSVCAQEIPAADVASRRMERPPRDGWRIGPDLQSFRTTEVPAQARRAAPKTDWNRVTRLRSGQRITLETVDGTRLTGRLIEVNNAAVILETIAGPRPLARVDVSRITAHVTTRMTAAGFLAAAGVGLLIANAASRPAETLPGKMWFAGVPLGVVGAVLIHREKPRIGVIYTRP